jgi:MFS family permease
MNFLQFFIANKKILLFGVLLTFFSGFGQTFLLSLYIPHIITEFKISQSLFSTIYATATMCSGLTIVFAGKLIDRKPLMKFSIIVITGIIAANIFAGLTLNLVMIFIAIFMLRFFGQGLLSHTSMTSMGRYFNHTRGKALSIAQLGYPIAEAIFPITIVSLIMAYGWRESFLISAGFMALTLLPIAWFLIRDFDKSKIKESIPVLAKHKESARVIDKIWSQKEIIRDLNFYTFAPTVFIVGFTLTSLFFFQTYIATVKGWTFEWMALSISAYAIASFSFSILSGALIDRFSAKTVFPFLLLPLALGLLILNYFTHPMAAMIFWFLTGITAGSNPTTGNALYAETYGVKNLGSIRSIFTFVMISSTAAGPVFYSLLLDKGFHYSQVHLLIIGAIAFNIVFVLWGFKRRRSMSIQ